MTSFRALGRRWLISRTPAGVIERGGVLMFVDGPAINVSFRDLNLLLMTLG